MIFTGGGYLTEVTFSGCGTIYLIAGSSFYFTPFQTDTAGTYFGFFQFFDLCFSAESVGFRTGMG